MSTILHNNFMQGTELATTMYYRVIFLSLFLSIVQIIKVIQTPKITHSYLWNIIAGKIRVEGNLHRNLFKDNTSQKGITGALGNYRTSLSSSIPTSMESSRQSPSFERATSSFAVNSPEKWLLMVLFWDNSKRMDEVETKWTVYALVFLL